MGWRGPVSGQVHTSQQYTPILWMDAVQIRHFFLVHTTLLDGQRAESARLVILHTYANLRGGSWQSLVSGWCQARSALCSRASPDKKSYRSVVRSLSPLSLRWQAAWTRLIGFPFEDTLHISKAQFASPSNQPSNYSSLADTNLLYPR